MMGASTKDSKDSSFSVPRRTVVKGAAWAVPAVTVLGAAPAMAASPPVFKTSCSRYMYAGQQYQGWLDCAAPAGNTKWDGYDCTGSTYTIPGQVFNCGENTKASRSGAEINYNDCCNYYDAQNKIQKPEWWDLPDSTCVDVTPNGVVSGYRQWTLTIKSTCDGSAPREPNCYFAAGVALSRIKTSETNPFNCDSVDHNSNKNNSKKTRTLILRIPQDYELVWFQTWVTCEPFGPENCPEDASVTLTW
jgi:hypothetical protein